MKFILSLLSLLIGCNAFTQQRFITIDETKININTIGIEDRKEGQPLIVFESGLGTPMDNWDRVLESVSQMAPVLTYDRPGVGQSEPDDELPILKNVADKLIKILEHLEMEPPYVLVGHSFGGLLVRGFAKYYPESLAGLVIIDPADFTENHQNKRLYYEVLGWEDTQIDSMLTALTQMHEKRKQNTPPSIQEERQVLAQMRETEFKELAGSELPNIPVHIITGGRFDMPKKHRSKAYDEEALFRSKMMHRVARWTKVIQSVEKGMLLYSGDAGHFVHYDDPELVISSIRIVLQDYELLKKKYGE